jgi:ankyrin repeat protein
MVEWLLTQCQAEANARDSQGARPLHYAAEGNKVDAIDVLLRNGAKVSMAVRALPSSFQIKSFQVGTLD